MRGISLAATALYLLQATHAVDHSMKLQQTLGSATVVRICPAQLRQEQRHYSPPLSNSIALTFEYAENVTECLPFACACAGGAEQELRYRICQT